MVAIPKDVMDLIMSQGSTKILVTAGADGQPHAIVCGSIYVTPDGKAGVGEVLMKRAKKNLKDTGKAALTVTAGPKAYELILKNPHCSTSGPEFDEMKAKLAEVKLPCFALWTFDVAEIWDESAGPVAGTKIC